MNTPNGLHPFTVERMVKGNLVKIVVHARNGAEAAKQASELAYRANTGDTDALDMVDGR